jgi:ketosteroid isomerase-like protein
MPGERGPQDACGVFGVWAPGDDVSKLTYFGLYALQHRGQESAGIAVSDGSHIVVFKDMGLVSQVFNEASLESLRGHVAIYDPSVTVMTNNGPRPGVEAIVKSFGGAYFVNDQPKQQLRMENVAVRPLSADAALVTGRFILSGGDDPERSGWFTLIWVRTAEGWRAVHDHTS